ncbi:MAG: AAA family ATPase [Mogibacterium sp.]|nr:AAA family ATPase [Mogibacterium sp.]
MNNITSLTLVSCGSYYGPKKAQAAAERFIYAASLLESGQYLCWQVQADEQGNFIFAVFSSEEVDVTSEDFKWIFRDAADVTGDGQSDAVISDMWSGDRKVYALTYKRDELQNIRTDGKSNDYYYDDIDQPDNGYFEELFDMLAVSGGAIRIIAGPSCSGSGIGTILISLTESMPLRMQTVFSLAVKDTIASEAEKEKYSQRTPMELPAECLSSGLSGMIGHFLKRPDAEAQSDENTDPELGIFGAGVVLTDLPEEPEKIILSGDAPIDDLELSVRSYNCLKRAQINTVGELSELSDDELMEIRNFGNKNLDEVRKKLASIEIVHVDKSSRNTENMDMLDELVGLGSVKAQVKRIAAFARMQQDMTDRGLDAAPVVLNMEFTGNPGTAKTTVARIVAGILFDVGLLESPQIVEAGRADLVAKYTGQTAVKVKELFSRARGRVLFIDEAYSLVEDATGSFGDEAINTIVQEMENHRNETIVIFAGYPDKMAEFFSRNPGLRSRVPFSIHFSDYSADEMVQIATLEASKRGFGIDEAGIEKLHLICEKAAGVPDSGNGRFCRNLIEDGLLGFAERVYSGDEVPEKVEFILTASDLAMPVPEAKQPVSRQIGFRQ